MQSQLVILDDVLVVSAPLIVLHVTPSQNLPVLGLKQFLHFAFDFFILLREPTFEKSHFAIEEGSVGFLAALASCLPVGFASTEHIVGGVEDLPHRIEAVGSEIGSDFEFIRQGLIIGLKVKDPEGIQMRVDGHMEDVVRDEGIGGGAVAIESGSVAGIAEMDGAQEEQGNEQMEQGVSAHEAIIFNCQQWVRMYN